MEVQQFYASEILSLWRKTCFLYMFGMQMSALCINRLTSDHTVVNIKMFKLSKYLFHLNIKKLH